MVAISGAVGTPDLEVKVLIGWLWFVMTSLMVAVLTLSLETRKRDVMECLKCVEKNVNS